MITDEPSIIINDPTDVEKHNRPAKEQIYKIKSDLKCFHNKKGVL